jgi:hypothetical protein
VLNDAGDIAFAGAFPANPPGTGLNPTNNDNNIGVFLNRHGQNIPVAQPGDPLPGGGHLKTAGFYTADLGLNNQGVIAFSGTLDTTDPVNGDGFNDTGLYTWSRGTLSLVARTGTVIPGLGTIQALLSPGEEGSTSPLGGGEAFNNRGQILFQATLTDGRGVLLLYTPSGGGSSGPSAVLSGPSAAHLAAVTPPAGTANAGATANGSAGVLPPQATASPATGASPAAGTSDHDAVDDLFAALGEDFGKTPSA